MFGRVASYRFVDSPSDGRYNLALSQSQLDSACLYESRSPTSPTSWNDEESRPISPISSVQMGTKMPAGNSSAGGGSFLDGPIASTSAESGSSQQQQPNAFAKTSSFDMQSGTAGSQQSHQTHPHMHPPHHHHHHHHPSGLLVTALDGPDVMGTDDTASYKGGHSGTNDHNDSEQQQQHFAGGGGPLGGGNGGETETKSISSFKSIGSTTDRTSTFPKLQPSHAATSIAGEPGGQEPILPAVLEFPEQNQEPFLQSVISELDVNSPNFKLAPVYTLYLCARYRASTHYRPDLQPTERAHKLTVFLHHVANLIQSVVQEQYTDAKILSFWMANSSEFLHFLKSDRHISAFSVQAQEVLAESVQTAFRNLVSIFHVELSQTLNQFLSENIDHDSAAGLVLSVLGSAMALLRRCRVNAALTIQLFSQLFHYINVVCFNKFVTTSHMCTSAWGKALSERLSLLELWAEKQGLELAADCHLAKINQCAQFLQAPKISVSDVQQLACSCFRLNSLQMAALLSQETIPRNLIDTAVRMAESVADELSRADGREIRLEESPELPLALLLPDDGFSCDVVRGIPAGLVDFLNPFQMAGWCRLASQPTSIGLWTVYMHQFNQGRSPSVMSSKLPQPEVQIIKLHKNANGMGLSIVAAKGAGQERLGIYIKSVVGGGAADLDGRLQAGDQLLEVDGQSLIGITQERAADHLVRTGPVVTLKVAKQGAIYHGLATLLQQPSPVIQRAYRRMSNPDISQRRYSLSLSHEDILSNDQLQQIHFDPRYRDCRSSNSLNSIYYNQQRSRSNSLNSIGRIGAGVRPVVRYDTPPSIYVEDYDTRSNSHSSREMIKIEETAEPETPVVEQRRPSCVFEIRIEAPSTESNLSFVADVNLDDIPFIDEDDADEEDAPGSRSRGTSGESGLSSVSTQTTTPVGVNPPTATVTTAAAHGHSINSNIATTTTPAGGNLPSIMINTASRRGSNASCRKTLDRKKIGPSAQERSYVSILDLSVSNRHIHNTVSQRKTRLSGRRMSERDMTRVGTSSGDINKPPQQQGNMNTMNNRLTATMGGKQQAVPPPGAAGSNGNVNGFMRDVQAQQSLRMNQMMVAPSMPNIAHSVAGSGGGVGYPNPGGGISASQSMQNPGTSGPAQPNSNAAYSSAEPPKVGFYPTMPSQNKTLPPIGSSPWEREEKEKESELRREHVRAWRDQQILELQSLPQRTPKQEEQLRTLILERDFERRAMEEDQDYDNDMPPYGGSKELGSLAGQPPNQTGPLTAPMTKLKQVEIKSQAADTVSITSSEHSSNVPPSVSSAIANFQQQQQQAGSGGNAPPLIQPKSILKHNTNSSTPSSPSKGAAKTASFAHDGTNPSARSQLNLSEITANNTNANQMMSQMVHDMNQLNLSSSVGSSALLVNSYKDNKRVSFHDEDAGNNNNTLMSAGPAGYTQAGHLIGGSIGNETTGGSGELGTILERPDPDRFIDETMPAMLHTPTTPDGENWNMQIQATPGVIGAQEVYRDPRTRRLAEQQQKQKSEAVPEKLSFKEKMKMFALESGENNTPKDKLKISRAQRDIDAVH
uniref:PDZ domain-containing protein n=1 Tax=Anopheles dirus TaxID=7168 RepID=A0A182NG35_9DIPT